MKDQIPLLAFMITFGGVLITVAIWLFREFRSIDKSFEEHRHDYKGRFKHVYQRILRLELWASQPQRDRKSLDLKSDLPDIGGDERKHRN